MHDSWRGPQPQVESLPSIPPPPKKKNNPTITFFSDDKNWQDFQDCLAMTSSPTQFWRTNQKFGSTFLLVKSSLSSWKRGRSHELTPISTFHPRKSFPSPWSTASLRSEDILKLQYWDQWNETQRVNCKTKKNMLRILRVLFACLFRLALVMNWDVFVLTSARVLAPVGVVLENKAVLMLWWVHFPFGAFIIMSRLVCFLGCSIQEGCPKPHKKCKKNALRLETQIFQKAATHPLWVSSSQTSYVVCWASERFLTGGALQHSIGPSEALEIISGDLGLSATQSTICHPLFPCIPTGSYLEMVGKSSTSTTSTSRTRAWNCNMIYKKTNVTHLPWRFLFLDDSYYLTTPITWRLLLLDDSYYLTIPNLCSAISFVYRKFLNLNFLRLFLLLLVLVLLVVLSL